MHHKRLPHKGKQDNHLLPQPKHPKMNYKDIMKEYENKVASINFRRDMIDRQRNSNYVNEFNRIKGVLSRVVHGLPDPDLQRVRNRQRELAQMLKIDLNANADRMH